MPRARHSYRLHKASGQAFVEISGRRIYLGKHESAESYERYHRLLAEHAAMREPTLAVAAPQTTVAELALEFWEHVKQRYVKHGKPTSERRAFRVSIRVVRKLYGGQPADSFGPLALVACRTHLMREGYQCRTAAGLVQRFYCRKKLNEAVDRIRRMVKWGVGRELVKATTWQALLAVENLRRGEAPDRPPVKPVGSNAVEAVRPFLTPPVRAMVDLQLLAGCRPGEVCAMRMCDLNMRGEIWEYRPWSHKTEHHDLERVIYLGPKAQEVLRPWFRCELEAPLFSPRDGRQFYFAKLSRKVPAKQRRRIANPKRAPGEAYTAQAYGKAIEKACIKAGTPKWSPNQLRHAVATRIRKQFGAEPARLILGHQSLSTTEIYAEADHDEARAIMRRIG